MGIAGKTTPTIQNDRKVKRLLDCNFGNKGGKGDERCFCDRV